MEDADDDNDEEVEVDKTKGTTTRNKGEIKEGMTGYLNKQKLS